MKHSFFTRCRRILWFSAKRYASDNHSQRAVALTYYTVFAIVPMAALLFGIAKGFDLDERLRNELGRQLYQHKEILEWVYKFADTTLKQAQGGIVAGVGVIALIWTVLSLASNVERAFNDVWGLPPRKNLFRRFSDYLAIVLLTPLALGIVGASGAALRTLFNRLAAAAPGLGSAVPLLLTLAGDFCPLLIAVAVFTLIYKFAPNTKVRFSSALFAGIVAGLLFQLLQDAFIFLQYNIFKFNRIYGTFAALPLFLVWLQWSWQIALFGAETGFVSQNIDSGLFDVKGEFRSGMRMRRADQLAGAALIYRNFDAGQGETSLDQLATELNLPVPMLENQLHELAERRVVYQVAGQETLRFAPGFPTESFTASDCLRLLDQADVSVSGLADILARSSAVLEKFDSQVRHQSEDPLLKDL